MWYYAKGDQRLGPVSLDELRTRYQRGEVQPTDLVWTDGMANWEYANQRPELADIAGRAGAVPGMPQASPQLNYGGYAPVYPHPAYLQPAGFWLRFVAWIIDYIIVTIGGVILGALLGGCIGGIMGANRAPIQQIRGVGQGMGFIAGILVWWLYYAFMESSANQGTLGKMALGLRVTDMEGQRLTFGRATGRLFAKILSGLILMIGYMMAGWTEKKQALHDMLAGTLVVKK